MVTECTAWYPNARWSSRLKERLLAVLESRTPHWADTFFFFSSSSFPRHKYPLLEKWIMGISVIIYTLRFQRVFLCECHRDSVTPQQTAGQRAREPSQRMMTERHTHMQYHRNHAAAADEQNYLQTEFTQDKNIKIHLYFGGGSDCRLHKLMTWVRLAGRGLFSECFPLWWHQTGFWNTLTYVCLCGHLLSRQLALKRTLREKIPKTHVHTCPRGVHNSQCCFEMSRSSPS